MAYELYIYTPEGVEPSGTPESVVRAFASAGIPCAEEPDEFGHWLVLDGIESALDLTTKDGGVTGANFRFVTEDDDSVIQRVADVFKGLGFLVSDDEGDL